MDFEKIAAFFWRLDAGDIGKMAGCALLAWIFGGLLIPIAIVIWRNVFHCGAFVCS